MKKAVRVFSWIAAGAAGLCALCAILFWLLIVMGLSPRLQTIWVCSAMRTMSHKYLATAFFSDETIDRIMRENEEFRDLIDSGRYVYADGHVVKNTPDCVR